MSEVKTLVYFDIEATGLKSSGRPRICEMSFVAVGIQDILQLGLRLNENGKLSEESSLPRIVNKLTLCVYPMAIIVPLVSDLTGLDNYNLSEQSKFSKTTGALINNFLSALPSPVCLVAHNGNAYDFPLLKAELGKLGVELNSGTLCADSLLGIKEILKEKAKNFLTNNESEKTQDCNISVNHEIHVATELMNAGMFETDLIEGQSEALVQESRSNVCQVENEETPKKKQKTNVPCSKKGKHTFVSYSKVQKSRKQLCFSDQRLPSSFKLANLHNHLLGVPPAQSHGAEADCLALLRSTAVLGIYWITWVKDNCSLFSDCKKMWG